MLIPNGHEYPNKRQALDRVLNHFPSPPPPAVQPTPTPPPTLLDQFIAAYKELESYRTGKSIVVNGNTLSIAAVTAAARYSARVDLDPSPAVAERVAKSRAVIADKMATGTSVYGVSTGFGGSADTRTMDCLALGSALLQHQHAGILSTSTSTTGRPKVLPLLDPLASTAMPESWVRGAILIRMNSLIRGHSGVRMQLIEKMGQLLRWDITPLVPLRGSISASGDLSPLSYIAGTLVGNPSIQVFASDIADSGRREIIPSSIALLARGIEPISLQSKEHLGILNGTAFSASVAALALHEAVHLCLLAQVCTAMGTEALLGSRGSFDAFIHAVARPHPGQVEAARVIWDLLEDSKLAKTHENEVHISHDQGSLRQDRYPLRTAPQFLGPQIEDILSALATVTQECNSTTDNPLIDGDTGTVHHGGNFQAMAITNAMEKTRLALHHIGKLLFAQSTELVNPTMNRGLPPSLAATDPSIDYHTKGLDIAAAAYVGELGHLASPVSTHIQSAEMHNQAVNSLALVSARATINAIDVLSMLTATYLYSLCQALDLRAMQTEFLAGLDIIVADELSRVFGSVLSSSELRDAVQPITSAVHAALDASSTMDAADRMHRVAGASTTPLVDFLLSRGPAAVGALVGIPAFRTAVAERGTALIDRLRSEYLAGTTTTTTTRGAAPASAFLSRTRPVYEFVRLTLGVRMHGHENYERFVGVQEVTIGQNVSRIHEAIRDGKLQAVIVRLFS